VEGQSNIFGKIRPAAMREGGIRNAEDLAIKDGRRIRIEKAQGPSRGEEE